MRCNSAEPCSTAMQPVSAIALPCRSRFHGISSLNFPYTFCSAFERTAQLISTAMSASSSGTSGMNPISANDSANRSWSASFIWQPMCQRCTRGARPSRGTIGSRRGAGTSPAPRCARGSGWKCEAEGLRVGRYTLPRSLATARRSRASLPRPPSKMERRPGGIRAKDALLSSERDPLGEAEGLAMRTRGRGRSADAPGRRRLFPVSAPRPAAGSRCAPRRRSRCR